MKALVALIVVVLLGLVGTSVTVSFGIEWFGRYYVLFLLWLIPVLIVWNLWNGARLAVEAVKAVTQMLRRNTRTNGQSRL